MEERLIIGYEPIYVEVFVQESEQHVQRILTHYEPIYAEQMLTRFSQLNEVERRELLRSMATWIA